MNPDENESTQDFIEHQRERLETLRDQFLYGAGQTENEERDLSRFYGREVQDSGDEAALEAQRDRDDLVSAGDTARLEDIERALEKIADGSYGLSDDSGEPIDRARLEAMPEARFTVEEEALRERGADI